MSRDFYTGMDTTVVPDLNVEIDDLFSKRRNGAGSFGLSREASSLGRQLTSTHSIVAGLSSGEVRRPKTFSCSVSLPPVIEAGDGVRVSPAPRESILPKLLGFLRSCCNPCSYPDTASGHLYRL